MVETAALTDPVREASPGRQGESPGRASLAPLVVLLLAGAVVRLALWTHFEGLSPQIWDEKDYNRLAINLVEHGEFSLVPGVPISLRPPLYPAAVAGVYAAAGVENYQAVRLLQALLSLANVVLLYRLGTAVASRKVALWLAGLYCFYPSLLGYNNLLLTEVLFTFLLCAACLMVTLALQRDSLVRLGFAGVLLGLATLTRSVLWLFPPVLALFLLLAWRGNWARRLLAVGTALAAFALTLAPWAIRNTRLEKTFVVVDTMGGRNFMTGNYRYTPLRRSWDAIAIEGEQSWSHEVVTTYPPSERETQGQIDKLALRQGVKFALDNPGLTLHRDIIKFFDFWGLERELISGAATGHFGDVPRPALLLMTLLIFGTYVAAIIAAIFGIFLAPPVDRRAHWLLLLVVLFVCGMHALVFGHSRYHLPLMPLLLLYSASALVQARAIWRQRKSWAFWLACAVSLVLVGGWVWGIVDVDLQRFTGLLGSGT
jgi:4-amino-4-deoxy-L-arabinose transferase-like glycosyltransferase